MVGVPVGLVDPVPAVDELAAGDDPAGDELVRFRGVDEDERAGEVAGTDVGDGAGELGAADERWPDAGADGARDGVGAELVGVLGCSGVRSEADSLGAGRIRK